MKAGISKDFSFEDQDFKFLTNLNHPQKNKIVLRTLPRGFPNTILALSTEKGVHKFQSKYKDSFQKYLLQVQSGPILKLKSLNTLESVILGLSIKFDPIHLARPIYNITLVHFGWGKAVFKYYSSTSFQHNLRFFFLKEIGDFTLAFKAASSEKKFYSFGLTYALSVNTQIRLAFNNKVGGYAQISTDLNPNLQLSVNLQKSSGISFQYSAS